jgi:hypothetical protein
MFWFYLDFWMMTDRFVINHFLIQRCGRKSGYTRAVLRFYWYDVITGEVVDQL